MLKPRNKAANVITAILAAMMSILLVVLLFATALVGTVNNMTTAQGLGTVLGDTLQQIDFTEILTESADDMGFSEGDLQQGEIVNRLLKTDAAKEIIDLISQGIAANLNGDEDILVTGQGLESIVREHEDEIVDILCDIDPSIDRETVREEMLKYVDENAEELVGGLMGLVSEVAGNVQEITPILDMLKLAMIVLVVVCVVLAGAIYGCRWYRFGGFLWVGIDAAIAGAMTLVTGLLIKSDLPMEMPSEGGEDAALIFATAAGIGNHVNRAALILLGVGVLLIGLFILLRCTVVNPKIKAAKAAQEAPTDLPVAE